MVLIEFFTQIVNKEQSVLSGTVGVGVSCAGPGVHLNPCGSLPVQDIP